MPPATGVIKMHAMLIPPTRGSGVQHTHATITVRSAFTVLSPDGKKSVMHRGCTSMTRWLPTPSRHVSRRRAVNLTVNTGLCFWDTIDVHTHWTMPRAGHRWAESRSTVRVNIVD